MAERARRPNNARVAVALAALVVVMVGAAFAAVPLYRLFCQVTGFDGTTQRADAAPTRVLDRIIGVRFDTNVRGVPWRFQAEETRQEMRIGETRMAFFRVTNTADRPITGTALYNVVPESAGPYFRKLQCFCFSEQTIAAGATVEFPMIYFVDPEIASDPETREIDEITLSYTFFPKAEPKARKVAVRSDDALGSAPAAGL